MKFGVPWSVKGIRPEARETAKEAARRSGMPLGEWLNSVILQQADEDGARTAYDHDDEDSYGDDMSSVHQRLDDITRRIEQFTRSGPAAYAPKQTRNEQGRGDKDQIAQLIARLDRRLEQFVNLPQMMAPYAPPLPPTPMPSALGVRPVYPHTMSPAFAPPSMKPPVMPMPPGLDRAIAEITARQSALNGQSRGEPGPVQQPPAAGAPQAAPPIQAMAQAMAPAFVPVPSQDLSGLEEHLRQITDQIETLRRPGVEDAINALRAELGDIGRALNEAMPRQAIDAIEKQIQGLNLRIAEGRQAGADAGALSGVEHGLAEVRDALRGLTPAENLVGFNEAVDGLAHKIDLIVAQKDPETLGQLEHAITTLREMAGHVASNEAVGQLAAQVQELGEKVDHYGAASGAGDALNNLEHRIAALSDALAERSQSGGAVPPRLEALVESLSDKIEQIQQSRGDNVAAGHLEDQIVALVQRLDASDSRLGHLEAIERGLADLLVHIEEIRANKSINGLREETSPGVIELKHDIARTQDALNAVHGTLGHVVDRLATIEKDFRTDSPARIDPETIEITQPVGRIAARAVSETPPQASAPQPTPPPAPAPAPQTAATPQVAAPRPGPQIAAPQPGPQITAPQPMRQAPPPAASPKRLPPAGRLPINPNLPPDQPLEPGSGHPSMHASARIAASEAALGGARPAPTGPAGKSGFIAAARRAAQAAVETATPSPPRAEPIEADENQGSSLRASMMKRVKSLFIAASVVAVVVGSIQIAGNVMNFGGSGTHNTKTALGPDIGPYTAAGTDQVSDIDSGKTAPAAASSLAANTLYPLGPPILPGYMTPATSSNVMASTLPLDLYPAGQGMALLNPPALTSPALSPSAPGQAGDVTGSIPRTDVKSRSARPAPPPAMQEADRLPIAIGGIRLRSAAIAGDAAAAYEVAVRFAEGQGVPANPEEAARWYERAASNGLVMAQFRYASLLEKGQGVKKNLGQARRLYLAAAAKGHAKAMHNLAVLYAEGIEGKPDYITAVSWFRKAAQHGIADSQYNLGVLCARGLGTDKDVAEAYKWFALAAAQRDREAAKKRDEVAAHLDADALTAAQQTVNQFVAEPQPHAATTVPVPRGGWDEASDVSTTGNGKTNAKSRTGRAISANMPLNMFDVGRR